MARVITLSRTFLQGHPREGEPTYFVEKALASIGYVPTNKTIGEWVSEFPPKHHTIRFGRRWKTGDMASLRVWSGKPYKSKQVAICPDVKLRVVDIVVDYKNGLICEEFNGRGFRLLKPESLALNDGLTFEDFVAWFEFKKHKGKDIAKQAQVLIWGAVDEY